MRVLTLLESVLGKSSKSSGDNVKFHCPNCNHQKKKLEVNIDKSLWHCWVCDEGGKSLFTLLKFVNAPSKVFSQLSSILGRRRYKKFTEKSKNYVYSLPKEYRNLITDNDSLYARAATQYLIGRGFNINDIIRYKIGYCTRGEYDEMIIIPSFDSNGKVNFYTGRDFMGNYVKHKNPEASKDVIGFESFINWNLPITLVEGAFDAITVRYNSIPLFGKSISDSLISEIIKRKPPQINIVLDADAYVNAVDIAEMFVGMDIPVKLIKLLGDDDPNSLGHDRIWEIINNHKLISKTDIFKEKLQQKIDGTRKKDHTRKRRPLSIISKTQRVSKRFLETIQVYTGSNGQ